MIVTDIDGTILKADATCSAAVRKSIKDLIDSGIKVVLATGRMFRATYPVADDLGIRTPIISYQGGLIKEYNGNGDKNGKILYSKYTDKDLAHEAIDYFRANGTHINIYVNDTLYVEKDDTYIRKYVENRNIVYTVVKDLKQVPMDGLHKVLGIDKDENKILRITNELKEKYENKLYIIRSTPHFCEVSNIEASKAAALNFLREYWGLKKEEVLAIGDQDNDIDMIEAAGTGVAMGNGTPILKSKANYITKSVENDGFSYAIKEFCNV